MTMILEEIDQLIEESLASKVKTALHTHLMTRAIKKAQKGDLGAVKSIAKHRKEILNLAEPSKKVNTYRGMINGNMQTA